MLRRFTIIILLAVFGLAIASHVAKADYEVALHVGHRTLYEAADSTGSTSFNLAHNGGGLVAHRSFTQSGMTLTGTVRNTNTVPIGGVPITAQTGDMLGSTWTTVATSTSRSDGSFRVRVGHGDSRLIRLWAGSTYLTFKELVSPTLRLYVHPASHHRLRFTGRISIFWAGEPPVVEIDSRTPSHWATLSAVKVNAHGAFRYTYLPARATRGFRFSFRLATLSTPFWSWAASPLASATVR